MGAADPHPVSTTAYPEESVASFRDEDLVACPTCDAFHRLPDIPDGALPALPHHPARATRRRDDAHGDAGQHLSHHDDRYDFLSIFELTAAGITQRNSIMDVVLVFANGFFVCLALAVSALIVVLPVTRFLALIDVLAPMEFGRRPARDAVAVFRLLETLKPWSMAEIFIVRHHLSLGNLLSLPEPRPRARLSISTQK